MLRCQLVGARESEQSPKRTSPPVQIAIPCETQESSQGNGRVVVQHRYSTAQARNHGRRTRPRSPAPSLSARDDVGRAPRPRARERGRGRARPRGGVRGGWQELRS